MSQLGEAIGGNKRVIGGPFGSKLTTRDYSESGVPVIRGSNMEFSGRWIGGDYAYVSQEKKEKDLRSNLAKPGDIIVTQRGTLGQVSIVPDEATIDEFVVSQSQMAISVDPESADRDFVYYYLRSPEFADYSETQTIQTGVPHINLGILREAPTDWPTLPEQREIAGVLGALDDKIEANRKAAACLEEMARALYRSWFVTFDPVHAKSQNRPPAHMDPTTATLFPDRFGEDGLPEGWEIRTVADACNHVKKTVKPMDVPNDPFLHFSLPAFDNGRIPVRENGEAIKSNKAFVPHDAILFSRLNPTIPRVWWAKTNGIEATPAASTEFYVASAKKPVETPWLYCLLSSPEFRDDALSRVTGTSNSHQRVPPKVLAEVDIVKPAEEVTEAFGETTGAWFDKIHSITQENQTLATLRDTLLPRLMSGTLRVKAAEAEVEAVV